MNDLIKIVGTNIKRIRITIGISQEELAFRAKLHRTYIGGIERGERNISIKSIEKIANALNIKPHILFMEENNESKSIIS